MSTLEGANKVASPMELVIQELKDIQSRNSNLLNRLRNKAEPFLKLVSDDPDSIKDIGPGASPLHGQLETLAVAGNRLNNELEAVIDRFVV